MQIVFEILTFCLYFQAPRLAPELEFMKALISIGKLLSAIPTKESKTTRLVAEVPNLNHNLPARVWLPLSTRPHHIVRIPPQVGAVLNSKDKAPYIVYVEVVEIDDLHTSIVTSKIMPTLRHTKSEENLGGGDTTSLSAFSMCGGLCDDNDPDWSQEDDEISQQVGAVA